MVYGFVFPAHANGPVLELAQNQPHHHAVKKERTVFYNTQSGKYHAHSCHWAQKCTRNCITITLSEAISRGGVPCKVCGGG